MSFVWGFAALDAILAVVLLYFNASMKLTVFILGGVMVSEIVARSVFHLFFDSRYEYYDAWYYSYKWDIVSLIEGEFWEDWKASWKLSLYHGLIIGSGTGFFYLLCTWFGTP